MDKHTYLQNITQKTKDRATRGDPDVYHFTYNIPRDNQKTLF